MNRGAGARKGHFFRREGQFSSKIYYFAFSEFPRIEILLVQAFPDLRGMPASAYKLNLVHRGKSRRDIPRVEYI